MDAEVLKVIAATMTLREANVTLAKRDREVLLIADNEDIALEVFEAMACLCRPIRERQRKT